MTPRSKPRTRLFTDRWWFPLVTLPIFTVYLATLNPSLFRNDSPETITACWTLGVPHPPGYPLFNLLGRLFAFLPVGNPAFTLNLFAAFCGTLGAFFFFRISRSLLEGIDPQTTSLARLAALIAAYLFAFSKSYWSASLAAKGGIYTFQASLELATLALFLASLNNAQGKGFSFRSWGATVFLIGLGLANQWPTELLFLASLLISISLNRYATTGPFPSRPNKTLVQWAAFGLLALSLYCYVPLRAALNPALNFGNPSNAARFIGSLLRTHYFKTETMASSIDSFWPTLSQKALYLSGRFSWEFPVLFSCLALWGIGALWRLAPRSHLLFLLTLTCVTIGANLIYLHVGPIDFWHLDDHLLTLNWATGFLGAAGLYALLVFLKRKDWVWAVPIPMLFLPFLALPQNLPFTDQTREFLYRGIGMEALRSMEKDPRYFAESDFDYFSLLYLREVEGKRRDLELHLTTFLGREDWNDLASGKHPDPSVGARPRYCAFPNGDLVNGLLKRTSSVSFYPTGTVIQFMTAAEKGRSHPDRGPLDDLWVRYLVPALEGEGTFVRQKGLNPINGLMVELSAHPYLNLSHYLRSQGDLSHWDLDQGHALALVQDTHWRGEIWADKARGDLKAGRRSEAALELQKASEEFALSGDPSSSQTAAQLAVKIAADR